MLVGALVLALVFLIFVAPSWKCAPSLMSDILDSGDLDPPLPVNCAPSTEEPSGATLRSLESRREDRGLVLERVVTCKIPSSRPGRSSRPYDPRELANFYIDGTLQYQRHVFLAATQDSPGGTLFAVEVCIVPRWRYLKRLAGHCEAEL